MSLSSNQKEIFNEKNKQKTDNSLKEYINSIWIILEMYNSIELNKSEKWTKVSLILNIF